MYTPLWRYYGGPKTRFHCVASSVLFRFAQLRPLHISATIFFFHFSTSKHLVGNVGHMFSFSRDAVDILVNRAEYFYNAGESRLFEY
ncbi:hypothetical protein QLX08_002004 [Tetragonisca angustula]|uniref:Uncharacterized protein n=1 Tax=Tetragonisca angustula TaxID=166442 RepID=A0AAW1ACX2_9HYME